MRILIFADGEWGALCLRRLVDSGEQVLAVVVRVQPTVSSLGELAVACGIPLLCPERVNDTDFVQKVRALGPDLGVSIAYNQILKDQLLAVPRFGFVNCHTGLLPRYRGSNVINWAIINNEKTIGLTIHYMDSRIDTGPIILQEELPILWEDDYGSVLRKVTEAYPDLLRRAIDLIQTPGFRPREQDHERATYCGRRRQGDEVIEWSQNSLDIYNKIRAITHPAPGAFTVLEGRKIIIWQAGYDQAFPKYLGTPGEVVGVEPSKGNCVKTGDSTIWIRRVGYADHQEEFVPRFQIGTRFGLTCTGGS